MVPAGGDDLQLMLNAAFEARTRRPTMRRRTLKADGRQLAEKYVVALFARRMIFARMKIKR